MAKSETIKNEDIWLKDKLGIKQHVTSFANILKQEKYVENGTSKVYSISAEFGVGKTFFCERLADILEQDDVPVSMLNIWKMDFYDNPLIPLLIKLQELEAQKEQLLKEYPFEELLILGRKAVAMMDTIVLKTCLTHIKVLINKYNQLVYKDDYGVFIYNDFFKEVITFTKRFLVDEKAITNPDNSLSKVRPIFEHITNVLDKYFSVIEEIENVSFIRSDDRDNPIVWKLSFYALCCLRPGPVETDKEIVYEDEYGIKWIEDPDHLEYIYALEQANASVDELNAKSLDLFLFQRVIYWVGFFIESPELIEEFQTLLNVPNNTPQQKDITSSIDYEQNICLKLKELGFSARVTQASCDQGVDVLAEKNDISFAIQCKMYSHPVGNKAVQEVSAGKQHYNTDYGVVVSNSSFTKSAKQLANSNDIILLNDNQLEQLLKYTE